MDNWAGPLAIAIRGLLVDDTTVSGIVDTRVFPMGGGPQSPTLPYVTYVIPLSDRHEYTHADAEPQLIYARMQVDVWAADYAGAVGLYDAVWACLGSAEVSVTGWGTAKLFSDAGGGFSTEEVEGITLHRAMKRYWVMLAQ